MTLRTSHSGILALALLGCQNPEYTEPDEGSTGTAPRDPGTLYELRADTAPAYLDANLQPTNAIRAEFVRTDVGITTMPVNGLQPDFAGAEANLLDGVGFGTYPNADFRLPVAWSAAGPFKAIVTAEVAFTSPGDSILLCRSFATTCVELISNYLPGINVAIVRAAANVPDTEIGQIAPGVSAAVRGTGDGGLTIAITDPDLVSLPFGAAAGTPFTVQWTTARGATVGSLDWSVSITTSAGTVTADGNTAADIATAITGTGGVALIFDQALGSEENWPPYAIDYSYEFDGDQNGDFTGPIVPGIDLSPQVGLGFAPLYVYPTVDPANQFATFSGAAGFPHVVQHEDAILGAVLDPAGASTQTFVYSVAFNGDDYDTTTAADPGQGMVDFGVAGGGFYPSPAFTYSQTLLAVQARVSASVRAEVHRVMYARMAAGVAQANLSLPTLVGAINTNFGQSLTYTPLVSPTDFIAIGTDYADSNVDAQIATSCEDTYTAVLNVAVATTFRTQLNALIAAMEANNNQILTALITAGPFDMDDYIALKTLQIGLNAPPGAADGTVDAEGDPVFDNTDPFPNAGPCAGYDCNVGFVTHDIVTGNNYTGRNPSGLGKPALSVVSLWGAAPTPAVPAQPATFTGNPAVDHPAYPEIPAAPATVPVREQAAASINGLVMGVYGNFQAAVFGPGVPASNFSLAMGAGDPTAASGPLLTSLTITTGAPPPAE